MKNFFFLLSMLSVFSLSCFASQAHAADLGSANMFSIDLEESTFGSVLALNKSKFQTGGSAVETNKMGLAISYARRKTKYVQIHFSLDSNRTETKISGVSTTTWNYAVGLGPIFNLGIGDKGDKGFEHAWYLGALVGLQIDGTKTSRSSRELNHLWYSFELGKRFSLEDMLGVKRIVYSPSLVFKKTEYDANAVLGSEQEIALNIIKIDWFFD